MNGPTTTIIIEKELREQLKLLKITNRESYNEIIWRLVKVKNGKLEQQKN